MSKTSCRPNSDWGYRGTVNLNQVLLENAETTQVFEPLFDLLTLYNGLRINHTSTKR